MKNFLTKIAIITIIIMDCVCNLQAAPITFKQLLKAGTPGGGNRVVGYSPQKAYTTLSDRNNPQVQDILRQQRVHVPQATKLLPQGVITPDDIARYRNPQAQAQHLKGTFLTEYADYPDNYERQLTRPEMQKHQTDTRWGAGPGGTGEGSYVAAVYGGPFVAEYVDKTSYGYGNPHMARGIPENANQASEEFTNFMRAARGGPRELQYSREDLAEANLPFEQHRTNPSPIITAQYDSYGPIGGEAAKQAVLLPKPLQTISQIVQQKPNLQRSPMITNNPKYEALLKQFGVERHDVQKLPQDQNLIRQKPPIQINPNRYALNQNYRPNYHIEEYANSPKTPNKEIQRPIKLDRPQLDRRKYVPNPDYKANATPNLGNQRERPNIRKAPLTNYPRLLQGE